MKYSSRWKYWYCTFFYITCISYASAQKISINFLHVVDKETLNLDTSNYKNSLGQTFTINKFKYYISNVTLTNARGKKYTSKQSFLINEADEASKKITLQHVPKDGYTAISFTIGIDSIHNCSGVQTGALDPMNGMFWTWNTGYIFLKLEGKSPTSSLPTNLIEYHIGGFKKPNNCIRKITLPLTAKQKALQVKVDITVLLNNKTVVDFTKLPSVTDAKNATLIADNYANMFTLIHK